MGKIKEHPTVVSALLFFSGRSGLRVTGIADTIEVEISLIGIKDARAVINRIGNSVFIGIDALVFNGANINKGSYQTGKPLPL
jgi:uncharacterized membrane protein